MEEGPVEVFRHHLLEAGAQDPDGIHHELRGGAHGQKINFGVAITDPELLNEWADITAARVEELYSEELIKYMTLISVADGTNELVGKVASKLGEGVTALKTKRTDFGIFIPQPERNHIHDKVSPLTLVLEDVGTTGGSSAEVVRQAYHAGARYIEVLNTWQRSRRLPKLDEMRVAYSAVMLKPLPNFSSDTCRAIGYCAAGDWKLIERSK